MTSVTSFTIVLILFILCLEPSLQISGFEKFSAPCEHNDQCTGADFRLVCHRTEAVCRCARFYYWNDRFQECHLNATLLNLYFNDHKERHISDELNHDAGVAFLSIALAGIVSLSLGTALSIMCVLYACLFRNVVPGGIPQNTALTKSAPRPSTAQKTK